MIKGPRKKTEEKTNIKIKEEKSRSKSKPREEAPKKNQKKDKAEKNEKNNDLEADKKKKKNPVKMNPYFYFQQDVRAKLTKENPGAKPKEIMTLIGAAWKALDDAARKKYTDQSAKAKSLKENEGGNDQKDGKRKRSMGKNESKIIQIKSFLETKKSKNKKEDSEDDEDSDDSDSD